MKSAVAALCILGCAGNTLPAAASSLRLSYSQKHAIVEAYRAGDHYGFGLTFAAVVLVESSACKDAVESSAHAYGCAQVKEIAVKAVTGHAIPTWELSDPDLQDENMAIGARYLDLCLLKFGWPAGIGCYYVGIPTAARMTHAALLELPYTQAVLKARIELEKVPVNDD